MHLFTQDNYKVFELFVDFKKAGKYLKLSGDSAQCKATHVCEGSFILEPLGAIPFPSCKWGYMTKQILFF